MEFRSRKVTAEGHFATNPQSMTDSPAPFETPRQMQERAKRLIEQAGEADAKRSQELINEAMKLLRASIEATKRPQ